jgi:hypothetical protein
MSAFSGVFCRKCVPMNAVHGFAGCRRGKAGPGDMANVAFSAPFIPSSSIQNHDVLSARRLRLH